MLQTLLKIIKGTDPLIDLLAPTNNRRGGTLFNRDFKKWEDHIEDNLTSETRGNNFDRRYSNDGTQKELLKVAREHATSYAKPTNTPIWITLTHPLYMFLTHADELTTPELKEDAQEYLDSLIKLLTARIPRDRASIVLLETLHHYAAATSRLLEQGLVDGVIFTEYDYGRVLENSDLCSTQGQTYFSGGAYNGKCLLGSLRSIWDATDDTSRMAVVDDLVIDSPKDRKYGLKPLEIEWLYDMESSQRRIIGLTELLYLVGTN